jgi:YidC/Oxa1 family membrane protein insertase
VDRNLLLAFALSFLVLMTWTMLQGPPPERPPAQEPPPGEARQAPEPLPGQAPEPLAVIEPLPTPSEALSPPPPSQAAVPEGERIRVEKPLYIAELNTRGAGLESWELTEYDQGPNEGFLPIELVTGRGPLGTALVTPFEELGFGDLSQVLFDLEHEDGTTYAFHLVREGVSVRKTYVFDPDSYLVSLRVEIENGSQAVVAPRFAVSWPAHQAEGQDFREQALVALHEGGVERQPLGSLGRGGLIGSLTGRKAEQVSDYPGEIDWAGAQTTYFLSAVLPDHPTQASARFVAVVPGTAGVAQIFFNPVQIPPGQSAAHRYRGYLGPKEPKRLEATGSELIRSIDLGWAWVQPLTRGFNWLLGAIYAFIPNYGVAIIVLTILVRVVTAPLTNKQMRSMERMRALAPKLEKLKEKHGDDRQKQSQEMMALYQKEGVNPLGGCLPMLLQLPVFIGLFYALRSSIQLRHAPFVGWINDLSAPEELFVIPGIDIPVRVLPLIMGATMALQQRITPTQSMDPAQAKMMMTVLPVVMTVVFYQFASGLVLYWMVSNVLAIAHQLWLGRHIRAAAGAGKSGKKEQEATA